MNKKVLGKGLGALIPARAESREAPATGKYREVEIGALVPNLYQPRRDFDERELESLAESIRERGVVQPILVTTEGEGFRIVAGERRWRAAKRAGLARVPVVVTEALAEDQLELALIENIQRQDLNPLEEAIAYQRLREEFRLTQEEIARKVGKDRSSVANLLRLLRLPVVAQEAVRTGELSLGHAKALLALPDAAAIEKMTRVILKRGLSVRDLEARIAGKPKKPARLGESGADVFTRDAEEKLKRRLATQVEIRRRGKGGWVSLRFHSEDELMRLYDHLMAARGGEQ